MRSKFIFRLSLPVILILVLPLIGNAQKILPTDTSKTIELRIDPADANGGNASDFFEKITYIPLESTKESTFGKIDQLEVTDDYYIILDETTNCILFFTKTGKFHAKIDGGSYHLDYFKRLRDFKVNKWTAQIVVQTSKMNSYIYYDFNGKKLREVVIERDKHVYRNNYRFVSKDAILEVSNFNDDRPADSTKINYLMGYAEDLMQKKLTSALPYTTVGLKSSGDILGASGNGPLYSSRSDTSFLFAKDHDYRIYQLSPNQVKLKYQFIFPLQQNLPPNFIYDPAFIEKRIKYLDDHKKVIFVLSNYHELGNNLFFKASTRDASNKDEYLIYNTESGTLVSYERVLPDENNSFLPLWDSMDFANNGFTSDGTFLYTDFPSIIMFQAHEANKDRKITYPKALNDYFTLGTKKDNPVIIQLKPRQN
ncbi:MAG TPA: 6-bladed beta-propeller [Pedobacter sp.]|uniref:6-bladed beta-propeller n=1 Tax=Pedobacter sp. TaxID=1411316 RepID=UPI002D138CEB|nr:6-bladed beta-propeller [Pedobacter sp.]HMI03451.1 6-bladed beta-propeller [Pedobacter sp.]